MSSSAISTQVAQLKIGNVQNQADTSAVYNGGIWSFKNSTALTSVTITDSGNVGIGTASPGAALTAYKDMSSSAILRLRNTNATSRNTRIQLEDYSGALADGLIDFKVQTAGVASSAIMQLGVNSPAMTLDASGNLLVGATASVYANDKVAVENTSNSAAVALGLKAQSRVVGFVIRNSSGTYQEFFCQGTNTTTGSITTNGTTTAYNPSSDERLKENIEPLTNALAAIKKLQPRKYTWKSSGVADDGFIAQELQQIPEFAHRVNPIGERDGEVYYGVDYMRFVSYLTAAIQELSAKVETQAAEIEALKAK